MPHFEPWRVFYRVQEELVIVELIGGAAGSTDWPSVQKVKRQPSNG
jgi:hypothetical protein